MAEIGRYSFLLTLVVSVSTAGCFDLSLLNEGAGGDSGSGGGAGAEPGPADMIVLGQRDFHHYAENRGIPTGTSISYPSSIVRIGSKFVVNDLFNNRVLIFAGDPVTTTQLPIVIGQRNLDSGVRNEGLPSPTARSLSFPYTVATDGTRLFVADGSNHRVLVWNQLPTKHHTPADIVIGQSSFSANSPNRGASQPAANTLSSPNSVTWAGGRLWVSDGGNHRVLSFSAIATDASADVVLGQGDFVSGAANRGGGVDGDTLNLPFSVTSDGTRLFVGDIYNNRVLIWNSLPSVSGTSADVALGQADLQSTSAATDASSLRFPSLALPVGGRLYVSDYQNHRILYWSQIPVASGTPADGVIGQADFNSGLANRGGNPGAGTLNFPYGMASDGTSLWVADYYNHRILKFDSLPESSADVADSVYGQSDFASNRPNRVTVNALGFSRPRGIAISGNRVLIGDMGNNRILIYNRNHPQVGPVNVIGQSDFTSNLRNQGLGTPTSSTLYSVDPGVLTSWSHAAVDDEGRLYVADRGNHRVLVFNEVPSTDNAPADYVLGQPDFTTGTANNGDGDQRMNAPSGVEVHGDKLFVSLWGHHRILAFDLPITGNHARASVVIGQPDMTTYSYGTSNSKLRNPSGVFVRGGKLFVADTRNNRLMVWNQVPEVNGAAADLVIGQDHFDTDSGDALAANRFVRNNGSNTNGLFAMGIALFDGYLFVPEMYGSRIMAFKFDELATNMSASFVFGQRSFTTREYDAFGNPSNTAWENLNGVTSVVPDPEGEYVWVGEEYSHRVIRVRRSAWWKYRYPAGVPY